MEERVQRDAHVHPSPNLSSHPRMDRQIVRWMGPMPSMSSVMASGNDRVQLKSRTQEGGDK